MPYRELKLSTLRGFGFGAYFVDDKFLVRNIVEDSPAAIANLQIGDEIISIDDFDFNNNQNNEFCNYLNTERLEKAEHITLKMKRDGKMIAFKFDKVALL